MANFASLWPIWIVSNPLACPFSGFLWIVLWKNAAAAIIAYSRAILFEPYPPGILKGRWSQ